MRRRRPPRLLLDTHIWYRYTIGSERLSRSLREAVDDSLGSCWLSPISIWELGMLAHKGRIQLESTPEAWVRQALEAFPVQQAPINFEVAQRIDTLDLPHGDPADHFLAATALVYELTLVTLDQHLASASWLPTLM